MVLAVNAVSQQFGIDIVLENVTFRLDAREKVALVGRNGTGKTTLLRIITKQQDPTTGTVQTARGAKIGYLKQEHAVADGRTVLAEAEAALEHLLEIKNRLAELEHKLENNPTPEDLDEYALLAEHFSDAEGYSAESDVRTVLLRMGFTEDEFQKPTAALSGGEKTRLAIARLLLEEPDLLILDEPTNHLDLQATEWLESWIRSYHGAVLLVSHDREFLESTVNRVLELRDRTVKSYPGDFRQYLRLRAEDEARQAEIAAAQAKQAAALDEYVRRFINSQRTAQARGRQKQLEKLLDAKVDAPKKEKGIAAGFAQAKRSGDIVLEAKALSVGFPDETLFKNLDWTVRWSERWGVVGENGAGKSTLLKTLLGRIPPVAGQVRVGSNVHLGYFTQDNTQLDPAQTPLDHMVWECGMDPGPARDLLGRFLFSGDDVFRPIKTLSGGEKNKLVLATLTQQNPNLLVLDEPTNHLDMDSREALAQVLREYNGTLVLISHDRWLLAQTTDHTLDVRRSGPIVFEGGFTDYRAHQRNPLPNPPKNKLTAPAPTPQNPANTLPPDHPAANLSPRELSKEIQRLRKALEDAENAVDAAEAEIAQIEATLANPPDGTDIRALSQAHQKAQNNLVSQMVHWESTATTLDQLQTLQKT